MKNPNGYGTIKKLSGNRRRPFVYQAIIQAKAVRWTGDHQSVGILLDGTVAAVDPDYELSQ